MGIITLTYLKGISVVKINALKIVCEVIKLHDNGDHMSIETFYFMSETTSCTVGASEA